jgi:hypothetical protein
MSAKCQQASAFITTRRGFCYLTVKIGRQNFHLRRIRNYMIDAEDKRHLRRRHPDIVFDWKKIDGQLAERREQCRHYRSRRRASNTARHSYPAAPFYAVYEPGTRTLYADGDMAHALPLLDAILRIDSARDDFPSPASRSGRKPALTLVK